MSTKTSIKRIALVAAAALTIGGFSAVSASAAIAVGVDVTGGVSHTASTSTAGATAAAIGDGAHFVTVTITASSSDTAYIVTNSGGALYGAATGSSGTVVYTNGSNAAGGFSWSKGSSISSASAFGGTETLTVSATSSGAASQVITITPVNATTSVATATITWGAAPTFSAGNSSVYYYESSTPTSANVIAATITADSTGAVTKGSAGAAAYVGAIRVRLMDNQTVPVALASKVVSASVSGPGLVDNNISGTAASAANATTDSNGYAVFGVKNSGVAGVGTYTISYTDATGATTVLATKSVTFYNTTPATFAVTQNLSIGKANTTLGVATSNGNSGADVAHTAAVVLKATDSAGNIVGGLKSNGAFTAVSSDSNVLTATIVTAEDNGTGAAASGAGYYIVQPAFAASAASGSSASITVTWTDNATGLVKVSTAPIKFTVGGDLYKVVAAFDKASYDPGSALTLAFTGTDIKGNPVYDQDVATLLGATNGTNGVQFNYGTGIVTTAVAYSFVGGAAKLKTYAPLASGGIVATGTYGATAPTLQVGTTFTASATVTGGGDSSSLAYDAASAATDAANNAYEEAQNATQAASDALAAVKALAVQVKALIKIVNAIKAKLKA